MDAEWIVAAGTVLAVIGLLAAAPRAAGEALAIPVRGALRLLTRVWPGLRRVELKQPESHFGSTVTVSGRVRGDSWSESGSVEERIAHLRSAVLRLQAEIDEVHGRIDKAAKAASEEMHRVESELRQVVRELDQRVLASDELAHEIQTRGFPLASTGALVAGVPWFFVSPVGIAVATLLGGYGIWLARRPVADVGRSWWSVLTADGFFVR